MLILVVIVFVLGYLAITFEHPLKVNKAAFALITGVLCWALFVLSHDTSIIPQDEVHHIQENLNKGESLWNGFIRMELGHHLWDIAEILFFLIGAMTIVELVDIHGGFEVITNRIKTQDKRKLLWVIAILTFFLSAALDNLTTSIVMVSLLRKMIPDRKLRLVFAGMIVISANAGGAWSPIGDVTTTMLWIKGQITSSKVILELIVPSLVCMLVPLAILSFKMKGKIDSSSDSTPDAPVTNAFEKNLIFFIGVAGLIFVPVFKVLFHLPPYLGMMFSLGILWVVTEVMNKSKRDKFREKLSPSHALERIDTPSVLFFLGILLAVSSLETSGLLGGLANWLNDTIGNEQSIIASTGLLSAIVDNVPIVKAAQSMFTDAQDASLWHFLAYCAGTGGSVLIIGSAAGVAVMGMERMDFFWYLKKFSLLALIGYAAGAVTYLLMFPWHP